MEDHTSRALIVVMIIILIVIAVLIFLPHQVFYSNPVPVEQVQPTVLRTTVPVESHVYTTTSSVPTSSYQETTTTENTTTSQQ